MRNALGLVGGGVATRNSTMSLALVLIAACGWEWGRLNGFSFTASLLTGAVVAALCGVAWAGGLLDERLPVLWTLAGGAWVVFGAGLLRAGATAYSQIPKTARLVGGIVMLWLAWLAIAQARTLGTDFLLSVLLLVWTADIAAYAAGRRFGGRFTQSKLAVTISPGKSWEGVWGATAGVVLLAVLVAWLDRSGYIRFSGSLYSRLWAKHGVMLMLLGVVFLVAMSVVGDLVESLVKRSAGAKDSSGLLPGHGGVLDRVDALLPAVPLAMLLVSL